MLRCALVPTLSYIGSDPWVMLGDVASLKECIFWWFHVRAPPEVCMIGCTIRMLSKTVQDIRKTDCSFLVRRPVCLTTSIIPGKPTMSKQASDQGAPS